MPLDTVEFQCHGQLHAHFSNQPEGKTVTTERGWNIKSGIFT